MYNHLVQYKEQPQGDDWTCPRSHSYFVAKLRAVPSFQYILLSSQNGQWGAIAGHFTEHPGGRGRIIETQQMFGE